MWKQDKLALRSVSRPVAVGSHVATAAAAGRVPVIAVLHGAAWAWWDERVVADGQVTVRAFVRDGELRTEVTDTGPGIAPHIADLARLDRQLLANATGTGVQLTAGLLVGQSRELLSFLLTQETTSRARVLARPS